MASRLIVKVRASVLRVHRTIIMARHIVSNDNIPKATPAHRNLELVNVPRLHVASRVDVRTPFGLLAGWNSIEPLSLVERSRAPSARGRVICWSRAGLLIIACATTDAYIGS